MIGAVERLLGGVRTVAGDRPPRRSLGISGAALLVGSLALLADARLQRADVRVGDLVRRVRSDRIDRVIAAATDLGSLYGVVGVSAALAAAGHRRLAEDAGIVGTVAWTAAQGAKTRVPRDRPYEAEGVARLIRPPTGSSYPSGHAAVTAAMMSAVGASAPRRVRTATALLTVFVASSRVYVGVHYPSDVAGGVGIGLLLTAAWRTVRRLALPGD
jgi:undecaprenyl-diphosphatase